MKIKSSTKRLLTAFVLLTFMWLIFFATRISLIQEENNNLRFIPSTSTIAIRIDAKKLAESTFFSVLFEAKDEKVLQKLKLFIENPEEKERKVKNTGINYLSDIAIFTSLYKKGKIIGISLNLSDPIAFKENMPSKLEKNQIIEVIGNVGFIITYISKNEHEIIQKNEIQSYFINNISHLKEKKNIQFLPKDKKEIETFIHGDLFGNSTSFSSSKIQLGLIGSGIELNGQLTISTNPVNDILIPQKILEPDKGYFHLSSAIVPQIFQDSINSYCKKKGVILPELKSFSLNYKGINIINDETGMHTLPDLDLILEFKHPFYIENFINNNPNFEQHRNKFIKNQLIFDNKVYYISQINSNTVSIGISENPKIIENKSNEILAIKGNLSSLLKIDGGGMIVSLIEMVPTYRSSKELSHNIEKIDISINKSSQKKANLKGVIKFKKDHFAMNEILKFLLNSQIIL